MSLNGIASQALFKLDHAALARKSGQNNRKHGKDASRAACPASPRFIFPEAAQAHRKTEPQS
jgi:hypothetical protein